MVRIRRLGVLFTAVALAMSLTVPAWGQGPKHKSCQEFGHVFAAWSQGGAQDLGFKNGGQGIKSTALNGLFIPGVIDAQPPGSVAEVIHWEHSDFCEPA